MRTGESSGTRDPVIRVLVSRQLAVRPSLVDITLYLAVGIKVLGGVQARTPTAPWRVRARPACTPPLPLEM